MEGEKLVVAVPDAASADDREAADEREAAEEEEMAAADVEDMAARTESGKVVSVMVL